MKVLITGGAGFIGSHLTELLLQQDDEVFILDDVSTGSLANLDHVRDDPRLHLVVDSVLNPAIVNELVCKSDLVYHLAAAVGVKTIVEQPVRTLRVNLQGTERVLDACCKFDKPVLIASTSEVYGDHRSEVPLTELSRRIYGAIEEVLNSGRVTADLKPDGKPAQTNEVGDAVCAALSARAVSA